MGKKRDYGASEDSPDMLRRAWQRLQEISKVGSTLDLSAPVRPCWHHTQKGDLKKRRREKEKEAEIAQDVSRIRDKIERMQALGATTRPASKPPRTLRPLRKGSTEPGGGSPLGFGQMSGGRKTRPEFLGAKLRDSYIDQVFRETRIAKTPEAPPWVRAPDS